MSTFSYQNILADSAAQQPVNGPYRTVEPLELIARQLRKEITARLSYFAENLGRMFNKPQQPTLGEAAGEQKE